MFNDDRLAYVIPLGGDPDVCCNIRLIATWQNEALWTVCDILKASKAMKEKLKLLQFPLHSQ